MMKLLKVLTLTTLVFFSFVINKRGQTKLAPGDIVIKSIDLHSCDFSLVTLVDLAPGASFIIANKMPDVSELSHPKGAIIWTNNTEHTIEAGSEISFFNNGSAISVGTRIGKTGIFSLSDKSKQILIFQNLSSPLTFIAEMNWDVGDSFRETFSQVARS